MGETKVPNPFVTGTASSGLFELLKDQEWHTMTSLENWMALSGGGHKLANRLQALKNASIKPNPPRWPLGMFRIHARRGQVQMVFIDPIEAGGGVDEEQVGEMVNTMVDKAMKISLQKAVDEHMVEVNKQLKRMQESSVPILELHRYEANKKVTKTVQPAHVMMSQLLYLLGKGHHVYLYGDPGSGKSTAAWQAADALGRHYGYISLTVQTMDSRLLGFMSPVGKYIATEFFNCYTKGGVFCIDEMDNASGNLLTALNSCLENDRAAFPHGVFKRHKDFVVVATGNTSGGGANPMFPERRPFDKAFQERFTYIRWDYDTRLERAVALSIYKKWADEWTDYVNKLRTYCKQHHPKVLCSPRVTFKGLAYLKDDQMTVSQILEALVFKGLDSDTVAKILRDNPIPEAFVSGKNGSDTNA